MYYYLHNRRYIIWCCELKIEGIWQRLRRPLVPEEDTAHLTKILQGVDKLLRSEHRPTEGDIIVLRDRLDQLQGLTSALDAKILESLNNDDEIEAEVLQTEEVNSLITTAKAKITHRLTPRAAAPSPTHSHRIEPREHSDTTTRLPKLDLPQF